MQKEKLERLRKELPDLVFESFDQSFDVEYTHHSTAIEGNTLSLIQTKAIIEDGLSVGGKTLREIYEVVNHDHAFQFVKRQVRQGKKLDETITKELHALLMDRLLPQKNDWEMKVFF